MVHPVERCRSAGRCGVSEQRIDPVRPAVGLLYAGEMGTALAAALHARGVRVVTTVQGRSDETMRRSRASRVEILSSFDDVVATSDVVLSVVSPDAAEQVACEYSDAAAL